MDYKKLPEEDEHEFEETNMQPENEENVRDDITYIEPESYFPKELWDLFEK